MLNPPFGCRERLGNFQSLLQFPLVNKKLGIGFWLLFVFPSHFSQQPNVAIYALFEILWTPTVAFLGYSRDCVWWVWINLWCNVCWLVIWIGKVCSRVVCNRNYGAKAINFGVGARASMLQGVSEVAEAVKVTMGPKVLAYVL